MCTVTVRAKVKGVADNSILSVGNGRCQPWKSTQIIIVCCNAKVRRLILEKACICNCWQIITNFNVLLNPFIPATPLTNTLWGLNIAIQGERVNTLSCSVLDSITALCFIGCRQSSRFGWDEMLHDSISCECCLSD